MLQQSRFSYFITLQDVVVLIIFNYQVTKVSLSNHQNYVGFLNDGVREPHLSEYIRFSDKRKKKKWYSKQRCTKGFSPSQWLSA